MDALNYKKAGLLPAVKREPFPNMEKEKAMPDLFQMECIELFTRAAAVLSLPRSIGEIFGLLFTEPEPLALDDVVGKLSISKGSASQGLRWLLEDGAIKRVYVRGDRRDHYEVETRLPRILSGYIKERIEPQLIAGAERLARLEDLAQESFRIERVERLANWHRRSRQVLPLLLRWFGSEEDET